MAVRTVLKVTKSGGITIPKYLRETLHLEAGEMLALTVEKDGKLTLDRKHARCAMCGTNEDVQVFEQLPLCGECAIRLMESM